MAPNGDNIALPRPTLTAKFLGISPKPVCGVFFHSKLYSEIRIGSTILSDLIGGISSMISPLEGNFFALLLV